MAKPRVTAEGKSLGIGQALCDVRVKWWAGEVLGCLGEEVKNFALNPKV